MFTLVAYDEIVPTTEAGYSAVAAVPDQQAKIEDDIIYIGDLNQIVAYGIASGEVISQGYLSSPSLRRLALLDILPIRQADDFASEGAIHWKLESPTPLETNEGLEVYIYTNVAVPAKNSIVGVWLADGPIMPVSGDIFHVNATATIVEVDATWVNTEIDFRQTLPVGRYQIVGAFCWIADGMLFRFVPIGDSNRPGGVCGIALGSEVPPVQRNGGLGVWCEFDQITPPSVDILGNIGAAGTDVQMILDLIKVG